jgi:hypothetical protein
LFATLQGTNLVLCCPAWAAASYVLESTTDLDQNTWSKVTADLAVLCDQATFTVPSAGSAFFRLRQ